MKSPFNLCLLFTLLLPNVCHGSLPVVLWHGMGDTFDGSIKPVIKLIEDNLANTYVVSIKTANTSHEDFLDSYFKNANEQIDLVCKMLHEDVHLKKGFNLIGFSQGGQFARAVVQRCSLPVNNLITLGGQHRGVYGVPRCPGADLNICNLIRRLLSYGAYESFVQKKIVQAQYWNDPTNQSKYLQKSVFLADINNERKVKNQLYKRNLCNLTNFVMVKFIQDSIVEPIESEAFGFYELGQAKNVQSMRETQLYKQDFIGLKILDQSERLHIIDVAGNHLQFTLEWFKEVIIDKFLAN